MKLPLHMVMSFRVSELQVLLGFAGRNKSGRKHELLTKALQLLKSGCSPAVQMKIKELYRRRFPRKILTPSDLSMLHIQAGQLPSATALTQGTVCHLPYEHGSAAPAALLPPVPVLGPKHETDVQHLSPPIHPVHPDVKMKRLPFYDVYDELIKPTTLASTNSQRFEEAHFTFALTPQQVQQILTSRDILPGAKCDYTIQVQLRFCLCETSCPQEDYFPPNLFVKVNGKLCPLPGYLPPTKNGAEPKRPSRPVNITPLARLSATVPNTIVVNWSSEFGRNYSLSVYLVKQLTSVTLLQKLRAKGIRNPDHSRALIKEKLTADPDSEIATTSLRVSLMCPLGKMRLIVPCRAITCTHLQCFDAALYLQMNEKKPTWTCPVCDKKAPYDALIIDGLFMEILNSCTDCDEIQFMEDGSWCPMKPKKENQEVCQAAAFAGIEASSLYTVSSEGKNSSEGKKKVEVIDLTLDSSSDEEEPPAKKQCPVSSAALPTAAGPKGVLSIDHQPSSVLRSPPMAALGSDYLSNLPLPDYHPSYQVSSELQGTNKNPAAVCKRAQLYQFTSPSSGRCAGRLFHPATGAFGSLAHQVFRGLAATADQSESFGATGPTQKREEGNESHPPPGEIWCLDTDHGSERPRFWLLGVSQGHQEGRSWLSSTGRCSWVFPGPGPQLSTKPSLLGGR